MKTNNSARLYLESEDYYNHYINLINQAKKSIHLQTYTFKTDSFGKIVFDSLIQAASKGVKVYLIIDAIGSKEFETKHEEALIKSGVFFCRFNDFSYRWLYQWARRLHHKILLIDGEKSLVGGINICSNSYTNESVPHQLDFAVHLTGAINAKILKYCSYVFGKSYLKNNKKFDILTLSSNHVLNLDKNDKSYFEDVSLSINDWVYKRWQITKKYTQKTVFAKKNITIISSYFFPRKKFMKQLINAAKRNVKVRLILPKHSDWPSYVLATRHLYIYFLKNNVEIYEWHRSVLHAKLATVDGQFSTIGSFNLNYTGYQQNLELNVDIHSDRFTQELDRIIDEIILYGCKKIELSALEKITSLYTRWLQFFYYAVLSIIAGFSVGLTFQQKD